MRSKYNRDNSPDIFGDRDEDGDKVNGYISGNQNRGYIFGNRNRGHGEIGGAGFFGRRNDRGDEGGLFRLRHADLGEDTTGDGDGGANGNRNGA